MASDQQLKQGFLYAVRLLSASPKSKSVLEKRLIQKGYTPKITQQILQTLESQEILNEKRTVKDSVLWAVSGKRHGRVRIALDLKRKGYAKAFVEEALQNYTREEEESMAQQIAEEKTQKLGMLDSVKRKKRIYDYLMRKGFSYEICRKAVQSAEKKERDDNENF